MATVKINSEKVNNEKGFTLIELVLVVGLLAVSFGVTSDILISLIRSQTKTQVMNDLEQQSNFVSLKLEKELKNATDLSSDGSSLTVTLRDNSMVTYSVDGGIVSHKIDDGSTLPLTDNSTPGGVEVTCIGTCFNVHASNSPKIVDINLHFAPVNGGSIIPSNVGSVDIIDTIVVRGTYQ